MSAVDLRRFRSWGRGVPEAPPCFIAGDKVPAHVGIIMDGNGRWAERRGLRREAGHRAGTENIRRVIERLCEHGVRYLTLFAFSTENWRRPRREVHALMRLPGIYLKREVRELHEAGIRLRHL